MIDVEWIFELSTRLSIPIEDLGDTLSVVELEAWKLYLSEPRGERRNDYQAAQITKAIYDFAIGLSGKSKNIPVEEYLLKFMTEEDQVKANINNIMAIFGKQMPKDFKKKLSNISSKETD